jgi:hypothetical protein
MLMSFNVYSQVWYQIGQNKTDIECPDILEIKGHGYVISNECYGQKARNYQIESGQITVNQSTMTLSERHIISRSFLQSVSKTLNLEMVQLASGDVGLRQGMSQFNFIIID